MKKWNNPSIEELDLNATAYSPAGGTRQDGAYMSNDGHYNYNTYGPSGGEDDGTPAIHGNHPGIGQSHTGGGYVAGGGFVTVD